MSGGSPAAIEVVPAGPVRARLAAPPSKSVTNRALVLAALAEGESLLRAPLASDDTERMAGALRALGAEIETEPGAWRVRGTGGRLRAPAGPIDAGLSGTTMRFVAALATLARGEVRVAGRAPLMRRPVGPLVRALGALGAEVVCDGDLPPVVAAGGGLGGGEATIDAASSSQFVTALLLVAPFARRDVIVRVENLGAADYVEMTVRLMEEWGATVDRLGNSAWRVATGSRYRARDFAVEYDASAAAHLFALAMTTGGSVTVSNASPVTLQPDAGVPDLFARMGGGLSREGDALTVDGPAFLRPIKVDLSAMPDQLGTVAVAAALAPGRSAIRGVAVARLHESDRIGAIAAGLRATGADVEERPDGLEIVGGGALRGARVATRDDHRIAMAFAALGARVPGVLIEDPACVAKTYPAFWEDLRRAGVAWRPVG
ncbi:MAG: 3-phosphoshikimate 1-carboxyvinyltransferase [Acidobacteria bacterium]|nr:3-phosphoshikimate 1-carboxyvinyltransferase [Acidobacteriota bacterium]